MCLIIHNPLCKEVPPAILESALWQNQDGFGIFYHDTGEVAKTMCPDEAYALITEADQPYTCHFRYSTSGPIGLKQCHPFRIDPRYSLMMNGVIERLGSRKKVDTLALCELLKGLPEKTILGILRSYPCRFALLNRVTGEAILVNKDLWSHRDGIDYSKATCFPAVKRDYVPPKWKRDLADDCCSYENTSQNYYNAFEEEVEPAFEEYELRALTPDGTTWIEPDDHTGDDTWIDAEAAIICAREICNADPTVQAEVFACGLGEVVWSSTTDTPEPPPPDKPNKEPVYLAVYGTLKAGHGNHHRLAASPYEGAGLTVQAYPMVARGIPFVFNAPGTGHQIEVEVYEVSPAVLRDIDRLEGHPTWYKREPVLVRLARSGQLVTAWMYMINPKADSPKKDEVLIARY